MSKLPPDADRKLITKTKFKSKASTLLSHDLCQAATKNGFTIVRNGSQYFSAKIQPSFDKNLLVKSIKNIKVLSSIEMRNLEISAKSHITTTGPIRDSKVANNLEEPNPRWQ